MEVDPSEPPGREDPLGVEPLAEAQEARLSALEDMDRRLKLNASLLGVIAGLGVLTALYVARSVIVPFALALFGAFAVEPLVRLLGRWRIPRAVAALVVVALLWVCIQTTISIVADAVTGFEGRLPVYLATLQAWVDSLPLPAGAQERIQVGDPAFWEELLPVQALIGSVGSWARGVAGFIGNTVLVLMLMVGLVIARRKVDDRLDRAAGAATGSLDASVRVIDVIDVGIQRYMLLKTLLSGAVGLGFWLVLALFGADFAVLWGFLAFVMNFIPTVGPIVATVPAILMIFLQFGDRPGYAIFASVVASSVPFVVGNLVEPKVFGDSLNLNFFGVLFALVLWSFLWGVPGAVLSVPIMMAFNVVCREVEGLRPIHELLRN